MDQNLIRIQEGDWFLCKFKPKSMLFLIWINSFEYKLEMANIKNEDEKVKLLLNMLDSCVFRKIQKIIFPSDPYKLSYDDLIDFLEITCSCFQGKEAANFRFLFRCQLPNESVDHYAFALRKLFNKCTPNVQRMTNIKNQFIKGLTDIKTKNLLQNLDDDSSFMMTIYIARQRELAKNQK